MGSVLRLRLGIGRKEVKSDFTQFVYIFMFEVVGMFYYFDGCQDDVGKVSVDVCYVFNFIEVCAVAVHGRVFDCH
jgi:hypothetical protein